MINERFILTVVGKDHPGIIAGIAGVLFDYECNIQELNQTVLGDEFAMILLLQPTRDIDIGKLDESLRNRCAELDVTHFLRTTIAMPVSIDQPPKDRLIVTVIGSDKIGIVAGVASTLAEMNINIVELSAKPYIVHDVAQYAVVARVEVESDFDMLSLSKALDKCARKLSVEIKVQSQEIFRAMHEV